MTKKVKIITLTLGSLAILGMGGAYAENLYQQQAEYKECLAREEIFLIKPRQSVSQETPGSPEALKWAKALQEGEARAKEQCRPKTSAEIKKMLASKKAVREAHLLEVEEWKKQGLLEPQRANPRDLGIDEHADNYRKGVYQTNAWRGYSDEQRLDSLMFVIAGSASGNIPQGQVIILDKGYGGPASEYPTPTATGPVRITAEKDGVLTLESLAGTYDVYESGPAGEIPFSEQKHEKVTAIGGVTYYFDLKTRTFR
ncbi:MAG: hypothetical protein AAB552_01860 [Patescibacteria group bacterium]